MAKAGWARLQWAALLNEHVSPIFNRRERLKCPVTRRDEVCVYSLCVSPEEMGEVSCRLVAKPIVKGTLPDPAQNPEVCKFFPTHPELFAKNHFRGAGGSPGGHVLPCQSKEGMRLSAHDMPSSQFRPSPPGHTLYWLQQPDIMRKSLDCHHSPRHHAGCSVPGTSQHRSDRENRSHTLPSKSTETHHTRQASAHASVPRPQTHLQSC
eukprot:1161297-Pelagomonas_calceolata.AAC.8